MKKKILLVANSMYLGGVMKALLSMVTEIPESKYEITIMLVEKTGDFLPYLPKWIKVQQMNLPNGGADDIRFGIRTAIINLLKRKKYFSAVKKLVQHLISKYILKRQDRYYFTLKESPIVDEEFDVAISYNDINAFTTLYVVDKINAKTKIAWIHNEIYKSNLNIKPYEEYYKRYNHIFGVSEKCINEFIEIFPEFKDKTSLFYNIISDELIKEMSQHGEGFNDNFGGFRILTIGRLTPQKGLDIAIPVLSRLIKDGYNIKWYVIGGGSDEDKLRKITNQYNVEENFIFLGTTPNPYTYIKECDLYIQPSRFEGYCLTVAEARALNKPIIATDFAGAREQLINGETGIIINFSEDELYNTIKEVLNNTDLRKKLCLNLSKQKLDTTDEINKLYNIVDSI